MENRKQSLNLKFSQQTSQTLTAVGIWHMEHSSTSPIIISFHWMDDCIHKGHMTETNKLIAVFCQYPLSHCILHT